VLVLRVACTPSSASASPCRSLRERARFTYGASISIASFRAPDVLAESISNSPVMPAAFAHRTHTGYRCRVRLVACCGCFRHVRENETDCPFCGVPVAALIAATPLRPQPPRGLSRTAVGAFAAATFGTAGCTVGELIYGSPSPPWDATISADDAAADRTAPTDAGVSVDASLDRSNPSKSH
jgi:hypothetical protein